MRTVQGVTSRSFAEVTSERKPEGGEGQCHVDICRKRLADGTACAKAWRQDDA